MKTGPAGANMEPGAAFDLSSLLANRRWIRRVEPFPHVVAQNVFAPTFYAKLDAEYRAILARGLDDGTDKGKLARQFKNYDAYTMGFQRDLGGAFGIFMSRPWHDLMARLFDIEDATGDVNGGFHHHLPNSPTGWLHNDLSPGWFVDSPRPDGINPTDNDLCTYNFGKVKDPALKPRETVRAVACLFYFCNDGWKPGDGGETGFYADRTDDPARPAALVPPVNNSVALFECTPWTWHTFVATRGRARNSIVVWIHRRKSTVVSRWGEKAIVKWKTA